MVSRTSNVIRRSLNCFFATRVSHFGDQFQLHLTKRRCRMTMRIFGKGNAGQGIPKMRMVIDCDALSTRIASCGKALQYSDLQNMKSFCFNFLDAVSFFALFNMET